MDPLVSVILPVHNRKDLVGRAIDSVLQQTWSRLELLVVNDGSTDGTEDVLTSYGDRLTVLTSNRVGAYRARNAALERARGEFVAFIDSDDRWFPDRLERQLPLFANPAVGLVFGNALFEDARRGAGKRRPQTYFDLAPPHRGRVLEHLALRNFIPQSSVIVRKACLARFGPFSTVANVACDYAKWVEIAAEYEVDFVADPVFDYTQHPDNLSRDFRRSLESRLLVFGDLLSRTATPDSRRALHRILFNSRLYLALADPGHAAGYVLEAFGGAAPAVSIGRRCQWLGGFVLEQVRLVARRVGPGTAGR